MVGRPVDLDLVAASAPFVRAGRPVTNAHRERLRVTVMLLIRDRGAVPPAALLATPVEALAALDALLRRCEELQVPWTEVVSRVTRDYDERPTR